VYKTYLVVLEDAAGIGATMNNGLAHVFKPLPMRITVRR
jgi:hypothetical protein